MSYKSWCVYGVTAGGRKKILRRFPYDPNSTEAHDFAARHSMKDFDDILVEPSRMLPDLEKFLPVRPFKIDDTLPDVHVVIDADGREVATVRGPQGYRKAIAWMICSGTSKARAA